MTVGANAAQIASVVILRSDHNTHSLTAGDRNVKLAFHRTRAAAKSGLRVIAPQLPSQATPGIYMLFVANRNGVPSEGRKLVLRP